jgi:hypothetical protein
LIYPAHIWNTNDKVGQFADYYRGASERLRTCADRVEKAASWQTQCQSFFKSPVVALVTPAVLAAGSSG